MVSEKSAVLMLRKYVKKRYFHPLGTASASWVIADFVGADRIKSRIAGLLHDVARELPIDEQKRLARKVVNVDSVPEPILHQFAGAVLVKEQLVNDDEIVEAVMYHATGKAGMGLVAKVVFVADFVDLMRYVESSGKLMKSFLNGDMSFDELVYRVATLKVDYVRKEGKRVFPYALEFLSELESGVQGLRI